MCFRLPWTSTPSILHSTTRSSFRAATGRWRTCRTRSPWERCSTQCTARESPSRRCVTGVAGLLAAHPDGDPWLFEGFQMTGFSNAGDALLGFTEETTDWLLESRIRANGGDYSAADAPPSTACRHRSQPLHRPESGVVRAAGRRAGEGSLLGRDTTAPPAMRLSKLARWGPSHSTTSEWPPAMRLSKLARRGHPIRLSRSQNVKPIALSWSRPLSEIAAGVHRGGSTARRPESRRRSGHPGPTQCGSGPP